MQRTAEPWLIPQLQRLARSRPERLEGLIGRIKAVSPELYEELALAAVEQGELSHEGCSEALCIEIDEVCQRLEIYRRDLSEALDEELVVLDSNNVARIRGSLVSVWEVVREFRKLQSVAELRAAFPSVTELELRSALCYAGRHPDDITAQIAKYELMRSGTKEAYPFAVASVQVGTVADPSSAV